MVVLLVLSSLSLVGQVDDSLNVDRKINYNQSDKNERLKSDSLSTYYKNLIVGIPELFSLGFGYKLNQFNSLGIKLNLAIVDPGYILPGFGITLGFRYSHTFYFINDIYLSSHFTISPILFKHTIIEGTQIELSVGYSGNEEKEFLFIYEFGVVYSKLKNRSGTFFPSIKIGFQHNF